MQSPPARRSYAKPGLDGQDRFQPSLSLRLEDQPAWDDDRQSLTVTPFLRIDQDNLEENPSYQLGPDAPVLTTVDRNPAGRGRMIAELLLDRIRSAPDAAAVVRQVPLKLIHRKTHGPARQLPHQAGRPAAGGDHA